MFLPINSIATLRIMSEKGILSNIKNWIRGGQIVDHNIRMFRQVAKKVATVSLFFTLCYVVAYTTFNTDSYQKKLAFNYYYSSLMNGIGFSQGVNYLNKSNGQSFRLNHSQIANSQTFKLASKQFENALISALLQSIVISMMASFLISIYIRRRGRKQQADEFLRGGKRVSNKELIKHLGRKKDKKFNLGVIPILSDSKNIHFDLGGSTRTGKSQTLKHLIKSIRDAGDRALIYSTSYEFVEYFFDENKDVILNPLDDRSPAWSIWNETKKVYHYDDIASSIIPETSAQVGDPFWSDAARILLSNAARKLKEKGDYSTKKLLDGLFGLSTDTIKKAVARTEAGMLLSSEKMEKTALSVKAVLATHIRSFKFLTDDNGTFSIRDWVGDEKNNQGQCIFISARNDQQTTLKPLISCWVDLFFSSVMSLPEDENRRIWLIIDELASLQKLASLENALSQIAKYGGCIVISYQAYSQLVSLYGKEGAETIISLIGTKVVFRENNKANAAYFAGEFGEEEIKTTNDNITVSAHIGRDAVSLVQTEKVKPLVLYTEILNLDSLHGFYRLPGDYPVAKFKQTIYQGEKIATGFIESTKSNHIYMLEDNIDEQQLPLDIMADEQAVDQPPLWVTEDQPSAKKARPKKTPPKIKSTNKESRQKIIKDKSSIMQRGLS